MWTFFKKKNNQSNIYEEIEKREKERSVLLQKVEDEKIERGIKNEALRLLREYNDAPVIKIGDRENKIYLPVMNPFIHAIIIYDEETSKYKGKNIKQLVNEEYQRLKQEQEINNATTYRQ